MSVAAAVYLYTQVWEWNGRAPRGQHGECQRHAMSPAARRRASASLCDHRATHLGDQVQPPAARERGTPHRPAATRIPSRAVSGPPMSECIRGDAAHRGTRGPAQR